MSKICGGSPHQIAAAAPGSSPLTFDGVRYPEVPVLVISGEFDDQTSAADGEAAAARYPHARHIIIANSFHVNALPGARSECAAGVVQRFMADLIPGDASCASTVPPVPLVTRFARYLHELAPADAVAGNDGDQEALRTVSAALLTCADAITRAGEEGAGSGVGLRGGTFTAVTQGQGYRITLQQARWTEDLSVSGRIDWPGRSGVVHATVEVHSLHKSGALDLSWAAGTAGARATARGRLGGKEIEAVAAAP